MKYFAVFVVFGLFALSQALPVEVSEEKRLFFNKETFQPLVKAAISAAKGACKGIRGSEESPRPLISRACYCLDAAVGLFGDENVPEEKRFLFKINFKAMIAKVRDMIRKVCANVSPKYDDLCKCIMF